MAEQTQPPTVSVETQRLEIMTTEDLATYLKVEPSTVYERLRFRATRDPNPMPAHKMGGYWRFLKHEIDAWLLSLPRAVHTRKRKYTPRKEKTTKKEAA